MKRFRKFEQYEPEQEVQVQPTINKEKLNGLIDQSIPLLEQISEFLAIDNSRVISVEYYDRIMRAVDDLIELKGMI